MATQAKTKTSDPQESSAERRAHVHAILEKMSDVMFLSYGAAGDVPVVSARPLHVTKLEDDGTLWFMVDLDSKKVEEVNRHGTALITGQDSTRWIHVTGRVAVVRDRAKVRSLWSKMHEIWFPKGPDDPNVGLFQFTPEHAEYWDNSGTVGVKYLFKAAKALLTGNAAEPVKGLHGEIGSKP